jgi:hypothetical protein
VDCYIIALTPLATNINNLIADGSCSPMLAAPPLLGPLTANGGPTRTLALLPGSPCLNAAAGASSNDPGLNGVPGGGDDLALTTDQRGAGFVRTAGGSPDIGAFELRIQPDIVIGKTANPAAGLGNDRYNNSGAGQTLKLVSKRASLLRATFWIGNDGDLPDAIGLRGTRGNNLFRITYSDAGKNITSAVTGGTHATAVLAPGQTSAVSILVKPDRRKLQTRSAGAKVTWLKRRLNLILTCTSQNDPARQDVAKISVKHL